MQGQAGADVHIGNRPKTGGWWLSATRRAGWFHNYIGHLLLWSGIDFPEEPAFLDDAIKELREAVKRLPTYYQPWENLGDSYRFRVRVIADVPRRRELLMPRKTATNTPNATPPCSRAVSWRVQS